MATDYTSLKTELADFLARADLTSKVDTFIDFGEAWLNRELRLRAMQVAGDLTIDAQSIALPTGYLEARRLYLDTSPKRVLEYFPPEDFYHIYAGSETGKPQLFTIEGDNILFAPSPDTTYTGKFLYYKPFTALDDTNTTNWLLTNHPDLYLAACIIAAEVFIMNDARVAMWRTFAIDTVKQLNDQDCKGEHSGSALVIRTDTGAP